jgi:hypothetical protein
MDAAAAEGSHPANLQRIRIIEDLLSAKTETTSAIAEKHQKK